MATQQLDWSASDADKVKLANTLLYLCVRRLGGNATFSPGDIAVAFATDKQIVVEDLPDGYHALRAP